MGRSLRERSKSLSYCEDDNDEGDMPAVRKESFKAFNFKKGKHANQIATDRSVLITY